MRDRLIELLKGAEAKVTEMISTPLALEEWLGVYADYLLANGVIVPPCKVGDIVYRIYTKSWVGEDKVCEFVIRNNGLWYVDDKRRMTPCYKFGKTVFLTKEEAEQALRKEDEGNGNKIC